MKAILFDLDDTLYPEIDFVGSGFKAVAHYLSLRHQLDETALCEQMLDILQNQGRGSVFDTLLQRLELYTSHNVKLLLYLYRTHHPTIGLYEETLTILKDLRNVGWSLGMVTDGMASVQRRKIAALGLAEFFDLIICTDELGPENWKPSTTPFNIALEMLQVAPAEAVYIGDNPRKDFIGPNSMGMLTIQIQRHNLSHIEPANTLADNAQAKIILESLSEIPTTLGAPHVA